MGAEIFSVNMICFKIQEIVPTNSAQGKSDSDQTKVMGREAAETFHYLILCFCTHEKYTKTTTTY